MTGGAGNVVPLRGDDLPDLDLEAARRHFELFEKLAEGLGGWFVLSSFGEDPDTGAKIDTVIRPIENKAAGKRPAERLLNAAHALADDTYRNVYLAPVLLKSQPAAGTRGKAADVLRVLALPQDFDDDNAAEYLSRCPLAPDYVVESSPGRFQAWWPLADALPPAKARALLQTLTNATGADSSSATINQPMRVPGLRNWPSASKVRGGRPRTPTLARIVQECEGSRTSADDLEHALAATGTAPAVTTGGADDESAPAEWTTGPVTESAPIEDDDDLIERALASTSARAAFGGAASFSDLWNANAEALAKAFPAAGGHDESRADSALAMHLAWWTGKNCERIERLMRRSSLARDKWQREDYVRRTILTALDFMAKKGVGVYTGRPDGDDVPDWVANLNREHCLVNFNGRAVVLRSVYNSTLERREFEKQERVDFCALHPELVPISKGGNDETKLVEKGKTWLKHRAARTYKGGVAFAPKKELPPDKLNLWQGYGVDPKPGDWSLFRQHIREVIAAGDPRLDTYIMGWLARMVQQPDTPGETALVLRGGKGTGKTKFGQWLDRLWGQHAFVTGSANHLVGRFNMHLQDCVFLFADEAFFAGDKRHESTLKMLVTDKTLPIEGKGVNAVKAPNRLHILMASNQQWVVPASHDERRYCVIDISEHRKGRKHFPYFAAIDEQMAAGGAEAMLHDLLDYDLSSFEVRDVPATAALDEQKQLSLDGPAAWLYDVLDSGRIGAHVWTDEGLTIPKDAAYHQFCEYSKRAREYRPAHVAAWAKALRTTLRGAIRNVRPRTGGDRQYCLEFASLDRCRDAFVDAMNLGQVRWDDASEDREGEIDVFS